MWAFGALARWRFDDTAVRIDEPQVRPKTTIFVLFKVHRQLLILSHSQASVEKAVMAMGNRIGLQMSQLGDQGLNSTEFGRHFFQWTI